MVLTLEQRAAAALVAPPPAGLVRRAVEDHAIALDTVNVGAAIIVCHWPIVAALIAEAALLAVSAARQFAAPASVLVALGGDAASEGAAIIVPVFVTARSEAAIAVPAAVAVVGAAVVARPCG